MSSVASAGNALKIKGQLIGVCSLIAVITVVLFSPVIFDQKTVLPLDTLIKQAPWAVDIGVFNTLMTDAINVFYTRHATYQAGLAEGALTFWSDFSFSGAQFAPYFGSPFHYLLFSWLPASVAHDLLLMISVFLAGLLTIFYLRNLGLGDHAALFGAVGWMLNGYLAVWLSCENAVMMSLTLPVSLLCIDLWFKNRDSLSFVGLAISLSLAITTGDAHIYLFQMLFVGAYTLLRLHGAWISNDSVGANLWSLRGPVAALLVSLFAGALFVTHNLALLQEGHRESYRFSEIWSATGEVQPAWLLSLLFPDFFGSPTIRFEYFSFLPKPDATVYPYNNYAEQSMYAGIGVLLFAAIALISRLKDRNVLFFGGMAAAALLMTMGTWLYWPLMVLPGLALSTPSRLLYLVGFCLCVLAAIGAQCVVDSRATRKQVYSVAIVTIAIMLGVAMLMQLETMQRWAMTDWLRAFGIEWSLIQPRLINHFSLTGPVLLPPLILVAISGLCFVLVEKFKERMLLICVVVLAGDLILYSWNFNTFSDRSWVFPSTESTDFLTSEIGLNRIAYTAHFFNNGMLPFGFEDVGGYASFLPTRYGHLLEASQGRDPEGEIQRWVKFDRFDSPLLSLVNMKYVLTPQGISLDSNQFELVYDNEIAIHENKQVLPRAFLVHRELVANSEQDALSMMTESTISQFRDSVIVEESVLSDSVSAFAESSVNTIEQLADTYTFEIETDQPGLLFLSVNYDDDWEALVDDTPAPVVRANYSFMAVPVSPGSETVELRYESTSQRIGLWVSLATWFVLFVSLILLAVRRKGNALDS